VSFQHQVPLYECDQQTGEEHFLTGDKLLGGMGMKMLHEWPLRPFAMRRIDYFMKSLFKGQT